MSLTGRIFNSIGLLLNNITKRSFIHIKILVLLIANLVLTFHLNSSLL